jgi:signal transduction histidine kinase
MGWLRPVFQPPPVVGDLALALLITAIIEVATPWAVDHAPAAGSLDPAARITAALPGLTLAMQRRFPRLALGVCVALTSVALVETGFWGPVMLAPFVAMLNLVTLSSVDVWAPAAVLATGVLALVHGFASGWSLVSLFASLAWLGAAGLFGLVLEVRRRFQAEVVAAERWEVRSREEEARRRLAEERLGLAREVHDVVGHSLAVISLQAGVAEHLLAARPDEARRAVAAIRGVSRQALDDLRAELSALRAGGRAAAERTPAPGLSQVPELVSAMRDAGLAVQLDMSGAVDGVIPAPVATAGYRIVQEALTNVVRHAGDRATAEVAVRVGAAELEVEVCDDGRGSANGLVDGGGLSGMRERAAALGGRLTAGNRTDGGFRVWVSLPWGSA